ncbi:protein-L-isoaspartate O-methyltransferase [Curvibacter sp. CHRR-16]|uniref:protein-L-isoaspartate O-methyltransferase family protein n=1 Tax=Curvibacter sp. CHRR-16 TaxID=2835872 RepID=UPI001BDA92AF|nr:protein-L-isoaspartate O-methyltransferase [Curvibacter sp. CHRR-16]MBT0570978.1 protein-L-isoaspartate O-methyltransferase [Curvibacter sp. CHRR-16]
MNFAQARFNMIEQQIRPWNVSDPTVLDLLGVLPRENFAPEAYKLLAYADVELPLPAGQTMLFPRMEARMLQDLALQHSDRVLEIGAGSGYMAALLAQKAREVVSVEIEPELVALAQRNISQAGIRNVSIHHADGAALPDSLGNFDAIVLSGSVGAVPPSLLQRLQPQGRLVAIVGDDVEAHATIYIRNAHGGFSVRKPWDCNAPRLRHFAEASTFQL